MSKKIICIDYDGTYDRFPELLETIITKSVSLGYRVICATMRRPEEKMIVSDNFLRNVEVIHTSRQAKLPYLEKLGIIPDIWIDDMPRFLFEGA